ncbi:coproporphyrinogen III oxidase [Lysinibacillus alkalisoli]|uniref:Heme chaperone HemW n=1 Tax=Lysinibacillus alkalisoli TaxID=1911548 RepID=A0A917LIG6_9BACI|nr:radical SAM family heme chaperone HemW [Lysinibacillus alkalisoli]GGG26789.1 coproporphyrinogen III oxidase [Lysinibacillus alkalisoli]
MARGIYIHIPFCHQICNYCDFNKFYFANQPVDDYIEAVGQELHIWHQRSPESFAQVETIFLGGGTPTALSAQQLSRLLSLIQQYVPIQQIKEFTSEANPDELTEDKLIALIEGGVNRLSMGVQSFDLTLLHRLGRTHNNGDVFHTIDTAKKVGFTNISIDLMYGLPDQTMAQWQQSLQTALDLQLPHYSAYSLLVEPKTIFYIEYNKGRLPLPTPELEAQMYRILMQEMDKHQMHQYEISNFAKANHQSLHNTIYWDNDEYFGIGAGAHGYVNGIRYSNHGPLKKYMEAVQEGDARIHEHIVSMSECMEEQMFLGLRKTAGVNEQQFYERFNQSIETAFPKVVTPLIEQGLLERQASHLRLTKQGRFVGNTVFSQFLLEQ